jgi:hypothetical protein
LSAVYTDVGNNGRNAGDTITLTFDENVKAVGANIDQTDFTLINTTATFTGSDAAGTSNTVILTLVTNANTVVMDGSGVAAVSTINIGTLTANAIEDAAGNDATASSTAVKITVSNPQRPKVSSGTVVKNTGLPLNRAGAPYTIRVIVDFDKDMDTTVNPTISITFPSLGAGSPAYTGTPTWLSTKRFQADAAATANLNIADTGTLTATVTVNANAQDRLSFLLDPAGNTFNFAVDATGPTIATAAFTNNAPTTVGAGDSITLTFSEAVTITGTFSAATFTVTNATLTAASSYLISGQTVIITLGGTDTISSGATIELAGAGLTNITDAVGNSAVTRNTIGLATASITGLP